MVALMVEKMDKNSPLVVWACVEGICRGSSEESEMEGSLIARGKGRSWQTIGKIIEKDLLANNA